MMNFLFLGPIGMTEVLIIGLVVLLFFGGKKIPELMKGIGKGIKSFKEGVKGVEDDLNLDDELKDINKSLDSDKELKDKKK